MPHFCVYTFPRFLQQLHKVQQMNSGIPEEQFCWAKILYYYYSTIRSHWGRNRSVKKLFYPICLVCKVLNGPLGVRSESSVKKAIELTTRPTSRTCIVCLKRIFQYFQNFVPHMEQTNTSTFSKQIIILSN